MHECAKEQKLGNIRSYAIGTYDIDLKGRIVDNQRWFLLMIL